MPGPASLRALPILDADDVAHAAPYAELIDALAEGHRQETPLSRRTVLGPDGTDQSFLLLPAWRPGDALGVKLATVFPQNPASSRPSVQAVYVLFDGTTGDAVALLDGTELTYRKTAADSALGARFLARPDVTTLLMVGAGGLARHLVAAHRAARQTIERVLVWNRTAARADALAEEVGGVAVRDLDAAIGEADVISTATMTKEPLVAGRLVRPGTHLDLVGAYLPDHREVDDDAVTGSELYVDDRLATLTEDGDLVIPLQAGSIADADIRGDLWQLCRGEVDGRSSEEAITLFENGGGGHLDLMAAQAVWSRHIACAP